MTSVTKNPEDLHVFDLATISARAYTFKNILGNKYGRLTVISCAGLVNKNSTYYWNCACDCGNFTVVGRSALKSGATKSCGCLHREISVQRGRNLKNIVGQVYGKLTVLALEGSNRKRGVRWRCLCDCGKERVVATGKLSSGKATSCKDCHRKEPRTYFTKRLPPGTVTWKALFARCAAQAENRNLAFSLSINEFISLASSSCYYCGNEPKPKVFKQKDNTQETITRNTVLANGIDRIDSLKGYLTDNVRSCCKECNQAKNNMTEADFYK